MRTEDMSAWKVLIQDLKETMEQNQALIETVKDDIAKQKEQNKKEILELSNSVARQAAEMEELLKDLDSEEFLMLSDKKDHFSDLRKTLCTQLEKARGLVSYSSSVLEPEDAGQSLSGIPTYEEANQASGTENEERSRIASRTAKERSKNYLPKLFRKEHLLGNWIHYFNEDNFSCQSFWDDDTFQEYDFEKGRMKEANGGTYAVEGGCVKLAYEDGSRTSFRVMGFSDKAIDYSIEGNAIQFDYMPEKLLNDFLDASGEEIRRDAEKTAA